jgi:DNA helicase-2/ATP-dependent DNA helicase PcrA
MADISLSPAQQAVVLAPIGDAHLVLASAGSGKTRVLTERVRFLLSQGSRDGIVAFTFTNAAAAQLQKRLEDIDGVSERVWVGTIHSVAQRIIEQYGQTIGLPPNFHVVDREQDRIELFVRALAQSGASIDDFVGQTDEPNQRSRDRAVQRYLTSFSVIKREMLTEHEARDRFSSEPRIWRAFEFYQSELFSSDSIDFDDILAFAHRILLTQDWVGNIYRTKYRHVCVDEGQDLNRLQYEFIRAFCGSSIKSVLMVGDPNQMIYGFNGSSAEFMTSRFVHDFDASVAHLNENYRSTRAIIDAANKLKPYSQGPSDFALAGGVKISAFSNEEEEAQAVANTIQHLIDLGTHPEIEGRITLEKMVVIARNRFAFSALEAALAKSGIMFQVRKPERSGEAISLVGKVLDHGLRLRVNPKDWIDAKKLADLFGVEFAAVSGATASLEWFAARLGPDVTFAGVQRSLLIELSQLADDNPNIRKFVGQLNQELTSLALIDLNETDRSELEASLNELNEFLDCWTRFRSQGLGSSLSAFRNAMALGQLEVKAQPGGLTLSTVHHMKGLESDIVFIIHMCEGIFPDYRAQSPVQVNEERNTAFVAITRARRWLYLSYPMSRTMPWGGIRSQQKSRFIEEIERT